MSSFTRSRRGVAATVAAVVVSLLSLSVIRTSGADAAAPPDDLVGGVRGLMFQGIASPGALAYMARIDYPAQPAAFRGLQDVNVARTADGEGAFVLTSGSAGRLGVYAHHRDGRVRVAAVGGPAFDAWRRRGSERGKGYPLDGGHGPTAAEKAACRGNPTVVQTFALLREPAGRPHLLCVGPGDRATWAS
jgi:hypothetical protein